MDSIDEGEGDDWRARAKAVAAMLRRGFSQFLGFELFSRLLGAVVFTPITAALATRLISWSGSGAVSNYDLTSFFLSPPGLLYLAVIVTVTFALVFFEFGGLTALAVAFFRGKKVGLPQLFRFLGTSLPRLWKLSARQFFIYLAFALPCLAAAGGAYFVFLTKNDIYYYLQAKPPAFWYAATIAGVATAVFIVLATRLFIGWIFSVPILLLTGATPAEAMDESVALTSGRRREILLMLARLGLAVVLMLVILSLAMGLLKSLLLAVAGDNVGLVLTVTAALTVIHVVLAAAVGIVANAIFAGAVAHRFLQFRPEVGIPGALTGEELALLRRLRKMLRAAWVVALVLAALTAYAAGRIFDNLRLDDDVAVTAHRGSSIAAPENTMAAILLAVQEGADFVEIDVQETKDGTVVLAHDKDLKRVFDIDKGIWEVTYDEIKDLDSGGWFSPEFSDQRISTLAEVIGAVKGRAHLNIELKFNGHEKNLAREAVRTVAEAEFFDQCIFTSLDYAGLRRAAAADPRVRTGVIVTSSIGDITSLEADLLSVGASSVTRALIDRAHRKGFEVHVWTVNDVPTMNTMIGIGVDSIITDDPKLLGEVIRERASLTNAEMVLLQLADFADRRF